MANSRAWIVLGATAVVLILSWGYQFALRKGQIGNSGRYHIEMEHAQYKNATSSSSSSSSSNSNSVTSASKVALRQREKAVAEREKTLIEREKALIEKETTTSIDKKDEKESSTTTKPTTLSTNWEEEQNDAAAWKKLTPIKQAQIEHYRSETAMILNIHPTHHAGTAFCHRIGRNGIHGGIAPSFACMGDRDEVFPDRTAFNEMKQKVPWTKSETGPFVQALRPYFHMMSWEFQSPGTVHKFGRTLDDPDWDHPNLVSVIVMRDPLSRLLARDRNPANRYPGYREGELNRTGWWNYAAYNHEKGTDNFFLRILTNENRPILRTPKQKQTLTQEDQNHVRLGIERTTDEVLALLPTGLDETHFEHGKAIIDQFTLVLDIACLDEGMDAMGRLLHMDLPRRTVEANHHSVTSRERIGYDDVYNYLVAKNEWDIALYEYSKTISLVRCDGDGDGGEENNTKDLLKTQQPKP